MLIFGTKIVATLGLIILPVWLGSQMGRYFRERLSGQVGDSPLGSAVGAALGLLAFMLAFTFQLVANRFDTRKELLLNEVTAIRTTWLRAGLLNDEDKIPVRSLLREYVDMRILFDTDLREVHKAIARSKEIQDSLWVYAMALSEDDARSEMYSLFISSLNEMIDLHNLRIVINLQYRIPSIVLVILYFIAFISMLMLGFQFGVTGNNNTVPIIISLAVIFSAVMWLIYALDDPSLGLVRVNHEQVYNLRKEIR